MSSGVNRFRERLRVLVDEAGSQSALARKTGVSQQQIARFLTGERQPLTSTAIALARGAGVSLEWLTGAGDDVRLRRGLEAMARMADVVRAVAGLGPKTQRKISDEELDVPLMAAALECADEAIKEMKLDLRDRRRAEFFYAIYEFWRAQHQQPSPEMLQTIVRRLT
ncbi:MAG: helix-turn-helix domain-containing protein [Candidatus Binataceae bacterium]